MDRLVLAISLSYQIGASITENADSADEFHGKNRKIEKVQSQVVNHDFIVFEMSLNEKTELNLIKNKQTPTPPHITSSISSRLVAPLSVFIQ